MLQITTSNLKTRKKVEIDGQPYTVRKLGAGEQLTLSQYMREIKKLDKKEKAGTLTDAEEAEALKMTEDTMNIMAACFDDGGDGSKSKQLVKSLSVDELQAVLDEIFKNEPENQSQAQAA